MKHNLYTDSDENIPHQILDLSGKVVLRLCKICGKGESRLNSEPDCPGYFRPSEWPAK